MSTSLKPRYKWQCVIQNLKHCFPSKSSALECYVFQLGRNPATSSLSPCCSVSARSLLNYHCRELSMYYNARRPQPVRDLVYDRLLIGTQHRLLVHSHQQDSEHIAIVDDPCAVGHCHPPCAVFHHWAYILFSTLVASSLASLNLASIMRSGAAQHGADALSSHTVSPLYCY